MEMAREMTRNNPLVMQGVRRLVANVVGRGFVLDSDSGDKGIDDVNGYRWAEWSRTPEACDDQQELDFHGLEKPTLQHVIIDGDICSLPNRDGGIESQEGHRLKTPRNTTKNVVQGVQQDERRRRLAYWFTKEDIEPWRSVTRVNDTTQIIARDDAGHHQVFHHYLLDRHSQTRGVTAFAPDGGHGRPLGRPAVRQPRGRQDPVLLHDPPRNGCRGPGPAICRRRGPQRDHRDAAGRGDADLARHRARFGPETAGVGRSSRHFAGKYARAS